MIIRGVLILSLVFLINLLLSISYHNIDLTCNMCGLYDTGLGGVTMGYEEYYLTGLRFLFISMFLTFILGVVAIWR